MLMSSWWMGYGKQFQDFKCNVHIQVGKVHRIQNVPEDYPKKREIHLRLRMMKTWGIEASPELRDIHWCLTYTYWCKTGEYIQPSTIDFP